MSTSRRRLLRVDASTLPHVDESTRQRSTSTNGRTAGPWPALPVQRKKPATPKKIAGLRPAKFFGDHDQPGHQGSEGAEPPQPNERTNEQFLFGRGQMIESSINDISVKLAPLKVGSA